MYTQQITPPSEIGLIGLGAIGLPIAKNIIEAGYKLKVHNRTRNREEDPQLIKAIRCTSPAETALCSKALIICVTDDSAVEKILFGKNGAVSNLEKNSVIINLSTISPKKTIELENKLSQLKIDYLDAPVTGGTEGAKEGTLTILSGGKKETLHRVYPILNTIGSSINHFGSIQKGQEVKAINQILVAGCYAALAEAIALGQELNLPMKEVVKALENGAAGSWALVNRSNSMISEKYPLGFKVELHKKDLDIALAVASKVKIDLPITSKVRSMEESLIEQGLATEDISALHRYIKNRNRKDIIH